MTHSSITFTDKQVPIFCAADHDGRYYDPWGTPYLIEIDGGYDNQLANPYSANAGPTTLATGVIAWSLGSDQAGKNINGIVANAFRVAKDNTRAAG